MKDRQESMRIAAERMRWKKEKEKREESEFYQRITSGFQWLAFKIVVLLCTLMVVASTFDTFVDGRSKQLSESDWKDNRKWEYRWHKVLDVEGYMFTPSLENWFNRVEGTLEITYSPIFRTGKKLSDDIQVSESTVVKHEEIRLRSMFNWFPFFQILLLIPLFTLIFKQPKAWFNFARIASMGFIFPGMLLVLYFTYF